MGEIKSQQRLGGIWAADFAGKLECLRHIKAPSLPSSCGVSHMHSCGVTLETSLCFQRSPLESLGTSALLPPPNRVLPKAGE